MRKTIKRLIKQADEVYCKLKPSKIEGVGVFAIRPIKKGFEPWEEDQGGMHKVYESELRLLPRHYADLVKTYCIKWDNYYWVDGEFNQYHVSSFLNHSKSPNLDENFIALRNIKIGEELTVDYSKLDDDSVAKLTK